ncbi:Threonine/homoserine efflux transporter RhtA [Chitinophaga rupis]|uniref:Threonine/homoserine efflux transporter RhtA n=1 Tax=Chitinophaga rupis TaxID=573321 RepID=A0A1H7YPT7_9BACT|nr:DMT family transporter [Chitinophaga rupis]SEM47209.1 Threonine/homoserine efflux transporter RhtA [Chitinophaga rupis]
MVFAGACCFGILSTFVKVAYQEGYATGDISGSQACLGMCVLWLLYILTRKREGAPGPVWPVLLAGTSIGLCTHLYYLSVKWIPASVAIIFLMQFTWISMLLEWAFFRKRPTTLQLAAMLLIMAGTVMASGVADARGTLPIKGILLAMASAAVYGIYVVASGRVGNTLPALKKSALMMTGSTIIIFIIARPHFLFDGQLSMGLAKWALFLAFFGTIIPPLLFAAGIPKTGVVLGAILMTAELPVAVVTAHLVLKENMSLLQWAGVSVMLFAMVMGQKRSKE